MGKHANIKIALNGFQMSRKSGAIKIFWKPLKIKTKAVSLLTGVVKMNVLAAVFNFL
jgi:hypothetical protein